MNGPQCGATAVGAFRRVVVAALLAAVMGSCTGPPTPFFVNGPGGVDNEAPTLTFLEPLADLTRGQGERFLIRWTDSDRDDSAIISFALVNTSTNQRITLVSGIQEDDDKGPDSFSAGTDVVPTGTYNLLGIIDDDVNEPVEVFAETTDTTTARVQVTVSEPGVVPPTIPPTIVVTAPTFNNSVSQDDTLNVAVQPTTLAPDAARPYDPDSDATLYILLDLDSIPSNDDPANPHTDTLGNLLKDDIIVLRTQPIAADSFDAINFDILIDLEQVPARPTGEPYFIRATIDDATNPRVHAYAAGTINVVGLASGRVDLADVGNVVSGARWYGFTPQASLGSSLTTVTDFDLDGISDFVMVAQFANPQGAGLVGEAYLVYGQDRVRFGGSLAANSVSAVIPGVIFEGAPVRSGLIVEPDARTDGITSVGYVPDLSGDGRPELLFGQAHVHGALESMDWDPGDEDVGGDPTGNTQELEVVFRTPVVTVQVDDGDPDTVNLSYDGCEDLVINSALPGTPNGSGDLMWVNRGAGDKQWTLIKYADILEDFPDTLASIDITTLQAELELRIFNTGGPGTVFQALTDFDEQTTFDTFAQNGGEPEANVDYLDEDGNGGGLGDINGDTAGIVTIDVSVMMQRLLDGELDEFDDEIRFLIAPDDGDEAANDTGARSSEYSLVTTDRPTLRITYTRINAQGSVGCYPDPYVNNLTNAPDEGPADLQDTYWYAGGYAIMVNSQNRDNDPRSTPQAARLTSTNVNLELVGQEPHVAFSATGEPGGTGNIDARCDNIGVDPIGTDPEVAERISGARFVAGGYDYVDHVDGFLGQGPREDLFGQHVSFLDDLTADGIPEIIISAPRSERYVADLEEALGFLSTQAASTIYEGSLVIMPGFNYSSTVFADKNDDGNHNSTIPALDNQITIGRCSTGSSRDFNTIADTFAVFAENIDDRLGDGKSAGDFNLDGLGDILCGAPMNDRSSLTDSGATYILYGRNVTGDYDLKLADDPNLRTPMLRIRGEKNGDRIGWKQATGLDVNGDRIDDIFFASPWTDFGGVIRTECAVDYDGDGVVSSADDLDPNVFESCRDSVGADVFTDDACKAYDYNNDTVIDDADEEIFNCLADGGTSCCTNHVDNGFVGVIFGGIFLDGDRVLSQLATTQLPGVIFHGSGALHHAGWDVSSAGDFNQDGFGDILITAPGEVQMDDAARERVGVVYLIFGGTHLYNQTFSLSLVGTEDLPGVVMLSPYVAGRPNEAAPLHVALLGDINNDGFDDIGIGNPKADFIDLTFPQGPDAPGGDASVGRRSNAGDVYIVYGNNFGSNRLNP